MENLRGGTCLYLQALLMSYPSEMALRFVRAGCFTPPSAGCSLGSV